MFTEADEFEFDFDHDVDGFVGEVGVFLEGEGDVLCDGHGVEEGAGLEEDSEFFSDIVELAFIEGCDFVLPEFDGA